ncbi:unnamed protein product [Brachionus calyciflorus]|uniref:CCHC-type domain-containing protein n=1 Tax=Brachionus calyciflorus TaxID=104777 RepID=A0A813N854_9BILA|nr:unnamed protein product [Brachionus calyciflorus]
MFNELVLFLFQACASIFAKALTTIVVKVTVNLFNGQCGYGSHDKPDSVSNLVSPVASNVKWTQETPERVRRDYLESFTVKPDLTRAWYDSDQIGYNWADRRNDDVIANSEQQQTVPLSILNENKFNTWSTNPTNPFARTWYADDATREMETPVNPFKACDMVVNNKSDYDRSVRNQDFTAVTRVSGNMMSDLRESELQSQNIKSRSKEWAFKPTFYSLQHDVRTWWNRFKDFYTNLWNLAKYAYAYTGEFDQSKYDYLVKERFVSGLNEPSVFWRVDAAKPQTCAEAYDLVGHSYTRLEILKRNKPNIDQKSVVDQIEFRTEKSFIHKRPNQYHQTNKQPPVENKRLCHFCNKSGHVIADCHARKNQIKNMTLYNQSNDEPSV